MTRENIYVIERQNPINDSIEEYSGTLSYLKDVKFFIQDATDINDLIIKLNQKAARYADTIKPYTFSLIGVYEFKEVK